MYEDRTPEAIKQAIKEGLNGALDTREGSFVDDMLGPTAVELYKIYGSLEALRPMVWVDETSGIYLDYAAEDLGLEPRKPGTKARVTLQIGGTAGYTLPRGTSFLHADGLYFDTLEAARIPDDGEALVPAEAREALVPAEAREAGSRYNVEAGSILFQYANDARISSVVNPEAARGGTDDESDASLYARIVMARQRPSTSGNVYDYERWALEVPGVGAVRVFPLWDGNGTVKVLIADERRLPVDEAVVAACAEHIEGVRPIGARVTVVSAEAFPVTVEATVRLESGADGEAVERAYAASLEEYFSGIALEQNEIRFNRVAALLMVLDGVIDYAGLTLNGRTESLTLTEEQAPVVGEVRLLCV